MVSRKTGTTATVVPGDDDEMWSPERFARWMGVTVRTVYWWNARDTGPRRITAGRHVRYRRRDIESWLRGRLT